MVVDPATPLGEIVRDQPPAAALFERLGIDYCCGGRRTLTDACVQRGLDPATVATLLNTLRRDDADDRPREAHDVARASIADLCEHIVTRHHGPSHPAMDRITQLLATVVRVHVKDHPELYDLQRLFASTRSDLEAHMRIEESALFPACRSLEAGRDDAFDKDLLALLEDEHTMTGEALCALRELAGGFEAGRAFCSTHKRTLNELRAFELDLHQHIHEENNILFPRVRAMLAAA
jgi:regulator of cell morphogenesis and NO signaling